MQYEKASKTAERRGGVGSRGIAGLGLSTGCDKEITHIIEFCYFSVRCSVARVQPYETLCRAIWLDVPAPDKKRT